MFKSQCISYTQILRLQREICFEGRQTPAPISVKSIIIIYIKYKLYVTKNVELEDIYIRLFVLRNQFVAQKTVKDGKDKEENGKNCTCYCLITQQVSL